MYTLYTHSRSVVKLTGSKGNIVYEGVYGGDILLRLTHWSKDRIPPEVDMTSAVTEQGDHIIRSVSSTAVLKFYLAEDVADQLSDHQVCSMLLLW